MRSLLLLLLLVSRTECSSFLFSPFSRVTMIMVIIITVRLASGCVYLSASGLPCVCPCSFHIPSNDEPVASYKGKLVSPAFAHTHTHLPTEHEYTGAVHGFLGLARIEPLAPYQGDCYAYCCLQLSQWQYHALVYLPTQERLSSHLFCVEYFLLCMCVCFGVP